MIRAVLDTNIFISALFWKGSPHKIVRRGLAGEFVIIISQEIIAEITETLGQKFKLPSNEIETFIEVIVLGSETIRPSSRIHAIIEDPADNKIIECAIAGEANYVVSGDRHVLNLQRYRGVAIVTPRSFLYHAL
jgi:putative PIN family toxin of toxin-antitoxin system